jgi:hypothetical protein
MARLYVHPHVQMHCRCIDSRSISCETGDPPVAPHQSRDCEWLWETPHKNVNGTYTINVQAYGSLNGNVNKSILQVQTWAVAGLVLRHMK